ncbi:hypothetical protein FHR70_001513 [Microvirga lupini]|uniref:Uncharacterized protein n=1 Tax=Microvirga lupini TaxID=420324 RepID=A0A7W4VJR3_9HYPH|nr:hypothetical protein [Microvirga lupini]MBB3018459.1 hypothetical protein [Microvirga lupini]
MKYKSHEEFFETIGSDYVQGYGWGEQLSSFTVEELYRHFKARYEAERKAGETAPDGVAA